MSTSHSNPPQIEKSPIDLAASTDWAATCAQLLRGDLAGGWRKVVSSEQAGVYFCEQRQAFVKLFYETKTRQRIKDFFFPRYARHQRFCSNTEWLTEHHFNAPTIVFHGVIDDVGCVVTAAFPGIGVGSLCANYLRLDYLQTLVNQQTSMGDLLRWKRHLAVELGLLVGKLHLAGVMHGDLRPNNVMVNCQTNSPQFCLIDNERNQRFFNNIFNRGYIKNLVQLNMLWPTEISATYRLLFLKSYLSVMPIAENKKLFAKKIQLLTRQRLAHKDKDGYRKVNEFQPFTPDVASLAEERL